jgi:phosphomevalonate kinase
VLSGAYAVLEGAPAVVSAVDRYVYCDSARAAERVTPEVRAALGASRAPYFDASELRSDGRKLGLGSSAAILVASLASLSEAGDELALRNRIFAPALRAHREAQGGGSGIDVAASTWGGTLIATRSGEGLDVESVELPRGLTIEAWSSGEAASTPDLIAAVMRLKTHDTELYEALMGALRAAATSAARALQSGQVTTLLQHVNVQREILARLGVAASAPIITPSVTELAGASGPDAAVLPSGAGGGDMVLWFGRAPSPSPLRALAQRFGYDLVTLSLHAGGAERLTGAASGS